MITLLTGGNSFEIKRALDKIIYDFVGKPEIIDGNNLRVGQLFDILMSINLFADKRLVVMNNTGSNKAVWSSLADWLPKMSEDIHLVLVEPKPDKRTQTYKMLGDYGVVQEFGLWSERDMTQIEKWLIDEAKILDVELDRELTRLIIDRVGIDQWELFHAIEKLALVENISSEKIKDVIDANPAENIFNLFEVAINGSISDFKVMFQNLKMSEDVYKLSALLFSQVFQLAVVVSISDKNCNVVKDFGIHPYVVIKLSRLAKTLGKTRIAKLVRIFAKADNDMKSSSTDPWQIIERALVQAGTA